MRVTLAEKPRHRGICQQEAMGTAWPSEVPSSAPPQLRRRRRVCQGRREGAEQCGGLPRSAVLSQAGLAGLGPAKLAETRCSLSYVRKGLDLTGPVRMPVG